MTSDTITYQPRMLYKQPDLLPLDQAVFLAGRKPGFFMPENFMEHSAMIDVKSSCEIGIVHVLASSAGFAGNAGLRIHDLSSASRSSG